MSPVWGDRAEELVCTYPSLSFLWLCGGSGCQCRQEHSVTGQGMAFRDGLRWESGRTEKPPALAVGSCHSNAYSWGEPPLKGILAGIIFFILFREVVIDETTTFSVLCSRYVGRSTGTARSMQRGGKGTGWRPEPGPPAQYAPGRASIHHRHQPHLRIELH